MTEVLVGPVKQLDAVVGPSVTAASGYSLAPIGLTTGVGVLAVSLADFRARRGLEFSEPLFWLGLLVLLLPIALALWSPRPSRGQRLGLVMLLGLGLYTVRIVYSPGTFAFFDEFSHWRTAMDIGSTGGLFTANPLNPISPLYPGLESFIVIFASVSGLEVSVAATLVMGVARLVVLVGLFLFFERASGSGRVAGLGALAYMANPSFLFFDAQFSYESFALALAATVLATLACRGPQTLAASGRLTLLGIVLIAATVVTHHLTSYGLVLFLLLWVLVARLQRRPTLSETAPQAAAVAGVVFVSAWLALVAPQTIDYLAPHLQSGLEQLLHLVAGQSGLRPLFEDRTGLQASLIERAVAYVAVLLTLLALVAIPGVLRIGLGRPLTFALGLTALLYPVSLVVRLTTEGAEVAGRMSAFAFVGVAFVFATWGAIVAVPRASRLQRGLLSGACAVAFAGGVILGSPPWARLPYPYRAAADSRSIDPEGVDAAMWTLDHLGQGRLFVADRTNRQLLGTYGHQEATRDWQIARILLDPRSDITSELIKELHIEYVLVDRRLSTVLPLVNGYVEVGEMGGIPFTAPLDPAALAKFDLLPGASRVFDSGDIQVFDVRSIR